MRNEENEQPKPNPAFLEQQVNAIRAELKLQSMGLLKLTQPQLPPVVQPERIVTTPPWVLTENDKNFLKQRGILAD